MDFCVLKEHQPLHLYSLPMLHLNLLMRCLISQWMKQLSLSLCLAVAAWTLCSIHSIDDCGQFFSNTRGTLGGPTVPRSLHLAHYLLSDCISARPDLYSLVSPRLDRTLRRFTINLLLYTMRISNPTVVGGVTCRSCLFVLPIICLIVNLLILILIPKC